MITHRITGQDHENAGRICLQPPELFNYYMRAETGLNKAVAWLITCSEYLVWVSCWSKLMGMLNINRPLGAGNAIGLCKVQGTL